MNKIYDSLKFNLIKNIQSNDDSEHTIDYVEVAVKPRLSGQLPDVVGKLRSVSARTNITFDITLG